MASSNPHDACSVAHRREFDDVSRVVNAAIRGEEYNTVRGFYAPSCYGKSDFIDGLWRHYRETAVAVALVHVTDLLARLGASGGTDAVVAAFVRTVARDLGVAVDATPDVAGQIVAILDRIEKAGRQHRLTLLLIDDYEKLPDAPRAILERDLLVPAIRGRKALLIITAKHEVKFPDNFYLRMRREFQRLTALKKDELGCVLPQQYDDAFAEIHQLTGGLPTLLRIFWETLSSQGVEGPVALAEHFDAVRADYYARALDVLFADVDAAARDTLFTLSVLRGFDLDTLAQILPELQPAAYPPTQRPDYAGVMGFLSRYGSWMQWRPEGRYMLHEAYRLVLQGYLLLNDRPRVELVHSLAVDFYRNALEQRYQQAHALDLLYHRWWLIRLGQGATTLVPRDEPKVSVEQLVTDLNGRALAGVDQVAAIRLHEALTNDPDLKEAFTHAELGEVIVRLLRAREEPVVWIPELEAQFSQN